MSLFFAKSATLSDPVVAAQVAVIQPQLSGAELLWNADIRRFGMMRTETSNMLIDPPAGVEVDVGITDIYVGNDSQS